MPAQPPSKPHGSNLRKGRISIAGQLYSITIVCRDRKQFFMDFKTSRTLIRILQEHEEHGHARTLCFVVMPEHLHWLMELGSKRELSVVIRSVKSLSSRRTGQKLWQKGYYDHGLLHDENIKNAARYIVANPLRAGIVKNIHDYPHWDAIWI